jgi:hypothetical protein
MSSIPGRDDVRIMTLQAHILAEQDRHAHAGTLPWILSALSISAKIIADKVRRARRPRRRRHRRFRGKRAADHVARG